MNTPNPGSDGAIEQWTDKNTGEKPGRFPDPPPNHDPQTFNDDIPF